MQHTQTIHYNLLDILKHVYMQNSDVDTTMVAA